MSGFATRLRTYAAIGFANAARVIAYRTRLKLGRHPVQHITAALPTSGPFYAAPVGKRALSAPAQWRGEAQLFGAYHVPIGDRPPDWMIDPLAEPRSTAAPALATEAWWTIGDFTNGDIKRVWELSRFDWVLAFAQQANVGEQGAFERLDDWLANWTRHNPAYYGPNWKCAQEASIRVMHLAIAASLMGTETRMMPAMRALVDAHIRRILPTISYARAQDNNHATSEAGALFVAGAWMHLAGVPGAPALLRRGRMLIERATLQLFARDGSFSQYSLNYHRLALDTLSIVECWRRRAKLPPFSGEWQARARAAAAWLRALTDDESGDAPNLGANDGANLLPLTDAPYRDFRPSAQLGTALFAGKRAYPPGPWDRQLEWLNIEAPAAIASDLGSTIFDDGGYAVLRRGDAMALLRYPRFRFRPSQADAMHVDLWQAGSNLLRDGGSFSYNTDAEWIDYFGGADSHNTIVFDGRPQMPRLSRFLLGDWLTSDKHHATENGFVASYRHREGWRHCREIQLADTGLRVIDTIDGFHHEAKLRWRLSPGDWRLKGASTTNGRHSLSVTADVPSSIEMVAGWESRRYLERTPLPVLEVIVAKPARIVTEYRWTP